MHLRARVAWSPFARRCAARQLVGAGEHSGKTETRWRHCALAGTDQLAPQVIFDSSSGELHACSLARKSALQICLLSAHSIFSSAARARCDGASRRRKIYSRGRRAEKGFRYAPQVRKHAARRCDAGYQGAVSQVSTEPQGHRYTRRARFTSICSVQFCRDMRVSVMICVALDEL